MKLRFLIVYVPEVICKADISAFHLTFIFVYKDISQSLEGNKFWLVKVICYVSPVQACFHNCSDIYRQIILFPMIIASSLYETASESQLGKMEKQKPVLPELSNTKARAFYHSPLGSKREF